MLRLQLELNQARGDMERRLQEKEEEAEVNRYFLLWVVPLMLTGHVHFYSILLEFPPTSVPISCLKTSVASEKLNLCFSSCPSSLR